MSQGGPSREKAEKKRQTAAAAAAGGGAGPGVGGTSKEGYDFSKSSIENITQRRFNFRQQGSQPVNVDQTLANLFDTLSVECR